MIFFKIVSPGIRDKQLVYSKDLANRPSIKTRIFENNIQCLVISNKNVSFTQSYALKRDC